MGDSNIDGDGGRVDGDGSGGNSPSRQGARPETPVPRTSSSMAAALRNFSWIIAGLLRVFVSKALYRRWGNVRGHPRGPHHVVVRPGGTRATRWCGHLGALLRLCFGLRLMSGKIGGLAFVSSNSENISYVTFPKHKNSRKQELELWHLVNRLVPENI
jgi:hypothetical protein